MDQVSHSPSRQALQRLLLGCGLLGVLLALANGICADERGVALARAEPPPSNARTALVIGNGAYAAGRLDNPANDAADMARALRGLGFDVIEKTDVDRRGLLDALRTFKRRLQRRGGAALFFYAGHGVQLNGRNYLIPIGADINAEADVEFEAVDANRVLGYMDEADTRLNVVILDACRDNPYARSFRSAQRGLAAMQMPLGELGSLLAYSTAPGDVAADGAGRNSPFTKHLLAVIDTPGLRLYDVFQRVRIAVYDETGRGSCPGCPRPCSASSTSSPRRVRRRVRTRRSSRASRRQPRFSVCPPRTCRRRTIRRPSRPRLGDGGGGARCSRAKQSG